MENEIVTQNGSETGLATTDEFANGLSFLNPDEMPDLDNAEVGISIQPRYHEFVNSGESVRGIYNGMGHITKKEADGSYKDIPAVVLQTKDGVILNAGASLTNQFANLRPGTAVQITYKGEEKTQSGNKVKTYDVRLLNVKVSLPQAVKAQTPAQEVKKVDYITMFWTKAKELRLNSDEASQLIQEAGGDFEKAYLAMTSPF